METTPTVRDRIIAAADALYEESERRNIPTVDAVRKLAKVNINDASNCMREWRRINATPVKEPQQLVPDKLQQLNSSALQALWIEAVQLSGETLRMAQAGWDAERLNADVLNEQIASACASQEAELATAKSEIKKQAAEILRLSELLTASQRRAEEIEYAAAQQRAVAVHIETRSAEISRRADDLGRALDQVHATHAAFSSDQAAMMRAQAEEIAKLRSELESVRRKAEVDAANAHAALITAAEEAACFKGRLEAASDLDSDRSAHKILSRQ